MTSSANPPPTYFRSNTQPLPRRLLSPSDFETSSIHSTAPSYISAAPTYVSNRTSLPSYTPPLRSPSSSSSPPLSLALFQPPTTSFAHTTSSRNPTARHYHSVAHRRATLASMRDHEALSKASQSVNPVAAMAALVAEREREEFGDEETGEEGKRIRPLEDPDLVGVEAAAQARKERLRAMGNEILVREDRRWDWLLGQMEDWDKREKSWGRFKSEVEGGKRTKLATRLGFGKGRRF